MLSDGCKINSHHLHLFSQRCEYPEPTLTLSPPPPAASQFKLPLIKWLHGPFGIPSPPSADNPHTYRREAQRCGAKRQSVSWLALNDQAAAEHLVYSRCLCRSISGLHLLRNRSHSGTGCQVISLFSVFSRRVSQTKALTYEATACSERKF